MIIARSDYRLPRHRPERLQLERPGATLGRPAGWGGEPGLVSRLLARLSGTGRPQELHVDWPLECPSCRYQIPFEEVAHQ